jgi:glycosyltransferase involved in cell wall biosynthesis
MSETVCINGRFLTHRMAGIPRFGYEMCVALHRLGFPFTVVVPGNIVLSHDLPFDIVFHGKFRSHLWEQLDLPCFLRSRNYPLLISFSGLGPVYYRNHISTIHDMAFARHSEWFSNSYNIIYKFLTPVLARHAKKILTVSNFSKREITDCLHIDENKIAVIYNALSSSIHGSGTISQKNEGKSTITEHYILAVSSHDPRKNFLRIIQAFKALRRSDLKLYIIGDMPKVFRKENLSNHIDSSIRILGHVDDKALSHYYRHADLFVYPSLYEGFGIPPLEAMSHECPVLLSDIPPLREIYGNSAVYCDPYDINSIAVGMERLLSNAVLRENLLKQSREVLIRYSWEASAAKLVSVLNECLI